MHSSEGADPQVSQPRSAEIPAGVPFRRCGPPNSLSPRQRSAFTWGLSCLARGFWPIDHDPTVLVHDIVFILLLLLSPMFLGLLFWLSMVLIHDFRKSLPI